MRQFVERHRNVGPYLFAAIAAAAVAVPAHLADDQRARDIHRQDAVLLRKVCEESNRVNRSVHRLAMDLGADGKAMKIIDRRFPVKEC